MFWHGRKVFLTGHTGFKGAWLSLWLERLGAAVTGFALAPATEPSLFVEADVSAAMTSVLGDVRDLAVLQRAMSDAQPELVIHMAAQSLVRASYADPVGTFATNVMGTVHVLEAARTCSSVRAVVIVTSDKCYANQEWVWPYRETDNLGGYDPYSNSKACAELATASYRSAFFNRERFAEHRVAVASARAGNVIGGGDWALDRLLPDAVRAFGSGAVLRIRNPHAVRPWQHVLEPLRGYLVLAQALLEHGTRLDGAWNFGPQAGAVQPVSEVVGRFAESWSRTAGKSAQWAVDEGPHPHEAHTLCLDCSKAGAELKWASALSFSDALELTAGWYGRFLAGENARALCLEQIAGYEASVTATDT